MHKFIANIKRNGKGFFALKIRDKTVGQVSIDLYGNELKILDTEVLVSTYLYPFGNLLLQKIVEYARMRELKIITLSKFAQQQFSSNPTLYADVWEKA
jgi:superoxide dismutase